MQCSIAILLVSILVALILFKKDDLIEARGGRGGSSSSGSSRSSSGSSSSRYSRSSSSSSLYTDRRRTGILDSRRRTDYSRRRSVDLDYNYYSRRRTSVSGIETEEDSAAGKTTYSWESKRWRRLERFTFARAPAVDTTRRRSDSYYDRRRTSYYTDKPYNDYEYSSNSLGVGSMIAILIGVGVGLMCCCVCCKHRCSSNQSTVVTAPPYHRSGQPTVSAPAGQTSTTSTRPIGYTPASGSGTAGPGGYAHSQSPAYFSNMPVQHPPAQYPPNPNFHVPQASQKGVSMWQNGAQPPQQHAGASAPSDENDLPEYNAVTAPPLPGDPGLSCYFVTQPSELEERRESRRRPVTPPPCPYLYETTDPVVVPPVEVTDDPSIHVSAPEDPPPPSYDEIFKT